MCAHLCGVARGPDRVDACGVVVRCAMGPVDILHSGVPAGPIGRVLQYRDTERDVRVRLSLVL